MGGNTSGKATTACTAVRLAERPLANHHAIGVAITNKIKVVDKQSRSVSQIAVQSSALKLKLCLKYSKIYFSIYYFLGTTKP